MAEHMSPETSDRDRLQEALEGVEEQYREEFILAVEGLARKLRYRITQEGEQ